MIRSNTTVKSAVILETITRIKNAMAHRGFSRKYVLIGAAVFLLLIASIGFQSRKKNTSGVAGISTSVSTGINKFYKFPGITGQGQKTPDPITFSLKSAEKTDQVIVKDQTFIAKNDKTFFILNLELKNETTTPMNILPGDLVRLTYNGDASNRYAPDLHNNLVLVSPISTKLDRVGFVIPKNARDLQLYIGELDGPKDRLSINFPLDNSK